MPAGLPPSVLVAASAKVRAISDGQRNLCGSANAALSAVSRAAARSRVDAADETTLNVNGHTVSLTRLSKVLYPKTGFTKAQLIDYYVRVAPFILPHLKNRPT